ncbi:MAG TPA: hypothetical protein VK654_14620 [Nitrospirota bacterium]|nr:hypothetical protein [Nitrospirota bacterium]
MLTQKSARRPIGRILLDGGFLSQGDLGLALEEQKKTNERLGQVLIRMGVLDPEDVDVVLAAQELLDDPAGAAQMAAGMRKMLGALLLQAGQITNEQLDEAVGEQQRTGERLGSVLVRRRLITEQQLSRVLDFQKNQGMEKPAPGPLRLGELLVRAGYITRDQLEDALRKQAVSRKKLGEVLIEEGYAEPRQIRHGMRLQQMLQTAVLVAMLSIGTMACGGGGGGGAPQGVASAATTTSQSASDTQHYANSWVVTLDEYGLQKPTFYYSTCNDAFWSIQANIAESVWDPNFKTIMRIDILRSETNGVPNIGGKSYSIEAQGLYEKFPGEFLVFNGQRSVLKKVESGTLSFSPASSLDGDIIGEFDVVLTDYDSPTTPAPQYHLQGTFDFRMGTYGPAGP